MEAPKTTPPITTPLIRWLDRTFPDTVPMTESPVDYYREQGKRLVINRLKLEAHRQDKEASQ